MLLIKPLKIGQAKLHSLICFTPISIYHDDKMDLESYTGFEAQAMFAVWK